MSSTFEAIRNELESAKVAFQVLEHEHVHRSHEAAKIRGNKIEEAAKALILKGSDGRFYQFVIAGHHRLSLRKIKTLLGVKNVALAPADEVLKVTGLTVGCIPPFGGLFQLPVYIDQSVMEYEEICFSAGLHTKSIRMRAEDYQKVVQGEVVDVAEG